MDGLNLLCEVLNVDFSKKPLDEPFSDEELTAITGWRGFCDRVIMLSGKQNPSVRDFVHFSGRGTITEFPIFVGTPRGSPTRWRGGSATPATDSSSPRRTFPARTKTSSRLPQPVPVRYAPCGLTLSTREGRMHAYNQRHPRGPVSALR